MNTFKKTLLLPLFFCAALVAHAAVDDSFPQAIALYPNQTLSESTEAVTFRKGGLDDKGLNRTIRNITTPSLTIYRPEKQDSKKTAVVICPGGGYSAVVVDREGHAYARFLQKHGITAVVLKYRLPDPAAPVSAVKDLPTPQQDALAAIAYVRAHAQELGVSPNRIGIIGSSAGGHLAGSTAALTHPGDISRPDFVVLLYPVTRMDDDEAQIHKGSRDNLIGQSPSAALVNQYTLSKQARPDMPPHFVVHATNDKVVPVSNATTLADALIANNVPVHITILPEGGHGFTLGNPRAPLTSFWKDQVIAWINTLP